MSFFYPSDWMAEKYCKIVQELDIVKNNENINIIGMSQGALNARFIIEACEINANIYNFLSIGGPNMGVNKLPQLSELIDDENWFFDSLNWIFNLTTFFTPTSYGLSTTGILRNHTDNIFYQLYLIFSPLLATLNNERDH